MSDTYLLSEDKMNPIANYMRAFFAGFLSTLIFHQGLFAIFYLLSVIPKAPYNLEPTQPFGVPSVISLAFFGGLWGVLIWKFIAQLPRNSQIQRAIIYGAIGPTLIALVVVMPIKGVVFNPILIPFGLLLNGAWGLGLWIFMIYPKLNPSKKV
jgi:hypothetical protein